MSDNTNETTETKKQRADAGKRRTLTNAERYRVIKLLEGAGAPDAAGKWWAFAKEWSDERIAREVDCSESQVAAIRRDCFGELKPSATNLGGIMPTLWDRIKKGEQRTAELERKVDQLLARLDELQRRPASEDKTRLVQFNLPHTSPTHIKPNGA